MARELRMDKNTLVAILGSVALAGEIAYGIVALVTGVDTGVTVVVSGSLGAIIAAAATYLKTAG